MKIAHRLCLAALVAASLTAAARGRDNDLLPPPEEQPLQTILDRIHAHAEKDAWREADWKDPEIEAWLTKLVKGIGAACSTDLQLPCLPADVAPGDAAALGRSLRDVRLVTGPLETSILQHSFVLVDGSARISSVRDSVVIVRGAATISSVDNSLIVAGHLLNVSSASARNGKQPSILLSRGYLDGSILQNAIVHGGEGVEASMLRECTLVNCKPVRDVARDNNKLVNAKEFALGTPPLSALDDQIEVIASTTPTGAVFRYQGRRLFAELNTPIVDEAGQPVEPLAGWQLTFSDSRTTVFSKETRDAVIRRGR